MRGLEKHSVFMRRLMTEAREAMKTVLPDDVSPLEVISHTFTTMQRQPTNEKLVTDTIWAVANIIALAEIGEARGGVLDAAETEEAYRVIAAFAEGFIATLTAGLGPQLDAATARHASS